MKYDVFISYSSKDKAIANFLCEKIEEQGLKCWIAPRNEMAGISYARQILQAISNSTVVLVCFSQNANVSEHVESEIDNAFNTGKVIIPFRIDNCEMSAEMKYYLNKKHWLNGVPIDDKSVNELISSIIANIPERAKALEIENSIDNTINMATKLLDDSKDIDIAAAYSTDEKIIDRLSKLKILHEMACAIEGTIQLGKILKDFIELTSKDKNITAYDIVTNATEELLIVIRRTTDEIDNPKLIYDGGTTAMLCKNKKDVLLINNLTYKAKLALQSVDKILVIEIDEIDAREYMAQIELQKGFHSNMARLSNYI